MKQCGRCKSYKDVSEFSIHRRTKDGLNYACKSCDSASRRSSRAKRLDKEKEYAKANKDRINAQRKLRRSTASGDRERAQNLARYHANKKLWSEWHRQWCRDNKEVNRLHGHLRRARQAAVQTINFTPEQLSARWAYYGNKCWICHEPASETDHVKPISKGGAHMLCNLRPICKSCNCSKHNKWPYPLEMAA